LDAGDSGIRRGEVPGAHAVDANARTPYWRPPQYGGDSRGTNVAGHQFLLRKRDALYAPRKITTLNPFRAVCGKRAGMV